MDRIAEVLRGLIDAMAHLMPPGRAGELHELVDLASGDTPADPPAEVPAES